MARSFAVQLGKSYRESGYTVRDLPPTKYLILKEHLQIGRRCDMPRNLRKCYT